MTIAQITAQWTSNNLGGTGLSVLYVRSTAASAGPLGSFFNAIVADLPSSVTVTVPATGRLIDEANGEMTGIWGQGVQTASVGTGAGTWPVASGCQVKWTTNDFVRGRRVVGRTYLVPLVGTSYDTAGKVNSTTTARINAAATTMIAAFSSNLVVWSRPVFEKDADGNPTDVLKFPGTVHTIQTSTVPTKTVVLTGRRDT